LISLKRTRDFSPKGGHENPYMKLLIRCKEKKSIRVGERRLYAIYTSWVGGRKSLSGSHGG
jgi:hypothetical protein